MFWRSSIDRAKHETLMQEMITIEELLTAEPSTFLPHNDSIWLDDELTTLTSSEIESILNDDSPSTSNHSPTSPLSQASLLSPASLSSLPSVGAHDAVSIPLPPVHEARSNVTRKLSDSDESGYSGGSNQQRSSAKRAAPTPLDDESYFKRLEQRKAANRLHARASRDRKQKLSLELQETVNALTRENRLLREALSRIASIDITCVRCAQINRVQITVPESMLATHLPSAEVPKTETPAPTEVPHKKLRDIAPAAPVGSSIMARGKYLLAGLMMVMMLGMMTPPISINSQQEEVMSASESIVRRPLPLNRKLAMLGDARITNDTDVRVECNAHVNTTETERLRDELQSWVERHERLLAHDEHHKRLNATRVEINDTRNVNNRLTPSSDERNNLRRLMQNNAKLKSWSRQSRPSNIAIDNALLEAALRRRYDTFYLVSLKDYVVLPATVINGTVMRPQMTLIVPAAFENATMTMMKIECEVTATGTVEMPADISRN